MVFFQIIILSKDFVEDTEHFSQVRSDSFQDIDKRITDFNTSEMVRAISISNFEGHINIILAKRKESVFSRLSNGSLEAFFGDITSVLGNRGNISMDGFRVVKDVIKSFDGDFDSDSKFIVRLDVSFDHFSDDELENGQEFSIIKLSIVVMISHMIGDVDLMLVHGDLEAFREGINQSSEFVSFELAIGILVEVCSQVRNELLDVVIIMESNNSFLDMILYKINSGSELLNWFDGQVLVSRLELIVMDLFTFNLLFLLFFDAFGSGGENFLVGSDHMMDKVFN
mmetsp:Transcript_28363/g.25189  ORF Transcript_28363/g.25189 Transcript_28363/m.25189 type:complete len:283 (-) Transcript_28363:47-895(-)